MELITHKLRDSLHSLLIGEYSPKNLILTYGISQYIKDNSKDIGEIITITVKLLDTFETEVASYGRRLILPVFRLYDLKGSYEIKSVQKQKCSYEDFQRRKSSFITSNDLAKEKEIDNGFSFRSFIDIRGELQQDIKKDEETNFDTSFIDIKEDLKLNIQRDIEIGKYDVYCSSDVIYDKVYKLELVIFNKKLWTLSAEDHKLEYYRVYIPEEFKKLKYELEKYYEYNDQKKHLSVIDFYISKFSEEVDKQPEGYIKECFALFNRELQTLHHDVKSYYGYPHKADIDPGKLVWTVSFQEFLDFFESLIERGNILYKGEKDKYSIYTNLLNNIYIRNQPDISIDYLMNVLKINVPAPVKEVDKCKLTWKRSRIEFAEDFKSTINMDSYEKSQFLYQGKGSKRAVVKKFHEIFIIENNKHPGAYISEDSLIKAFVKKS
jgi:hypothetical protein